MYGKFLLLVLLVGSTGAVPGRRKLSRIINGQLARKDQFPWQAAIFLTDSKDGWFCSGSVLSSDWILTATHCVLGATNATVLLGTTQLSGSDSSTQQVPALRFIPRNDFAQSDYSNDIALIRVSPIVLNAHVRPIRLGSDTIATNVQFTTSGWGSTSDRSGELSENLAFVTLTTISNIDCSLKLKLPIHQGTVCGQSVGTPVQSTCDGDSGGPAVLNPTSTTPLLIGVVSFASNRGCESGDPAGFTRVANYREWIRQQTGIL